MSFYRYLWDIFLSNDIRQTILQVLLFEIYEKFMIRVCFRYDCIIANLLSDISAFHLKHFLTPSNLRLLRNFDHSCNETNIDRRIGGRKKMNCFVLNYNSQVIVSAQKTFAVRIVDLYNGSLIILESNFLVFSPAGLPVKEESEEDPNSGRTIEPTTFVNVSLACDEAGPSGLQQQKIGEMPEMVMPTTDGDPKSGWVFYLSRENVREPRTTVVANTNTLAKIKKKIHNRIHSSENLDSIYQCWSSIPTLPTEVALSLLNYFIWNSIRFRLYTYQYILRRPIIIYFWNFLILSSRYLTTWENLMKLLYLMFLVGAAKPATFCGKYAHTPQPSLALGIQWFVHGNKNPSIYSKFLGIKSFNGRHKHK